MCTYSFVLDVFSQYSPNVKIWSLSQGAMLFNLVVYEVVASPTA